MIRTAKLLRWARRPVLWATIVAGTLPGVGCLGQLDGPFWQRFRSGFAPGFDTAVTTAFSSEQGAGLGLGLLQLQQAFWAGLGALITPLSSGSSSSGSTGSGR